MTKGRWMIFAALCLVVFGVLIVNTKRNEVNVDKADPSKVITDNKPLPDHVFGTNSKKVVLIEYGDFQCPVCGQLYPIMTPLKEYYKDQLTFVFRDFPITSLHPNALAGASVAEAAGLQDKFWEMHNMLYENQTEWSSLDAAKRADQFALYATRLGLDVNKFKKDIDSAKVSQKIKRDQALGKKIGTTGTPTLVLNGKILAVGAWQNPTAFETMLRDAIKASGQTLPAKMPATNS